MTWFHRTAGADLRLRVSNIAPICRTRYDPTDQINREFSSIHGNCSSHNLTADVDGDYKYIMPPSIVDLQLEKFLFFFFRSNPTKTLTYSVPIPNSGFVLSIRSWEQTRGRKLRSSREEKRKMEPNSSRLLKSCRRFRMILKRSHF